jgi:hypothetical protein
VRSVTPPTFHVLLYIAVRFCALGLDIPSDAVAMQLFCPPIVTKKVLPSIMSSFSSGYSLYRKKSWSEVVLLMPGHNHPDAPWRFAIMLFDLFTSDNFISSRVVRNLLNEEVPTRNKEGRAQSRVWGKDYSLAGMVWIEWHVEEVPKTYKMACHVVLDENAPFDVVAGKSYIEHHGFTDPRKSRQMKIKLPSLKKVRQR